MNWVIDYPAMASVITLDAGESFVMEHLDFTVQQVSDDPVRIWNVELHVHPEIANAFAGELLARGFKSAGNVNGLLRLKKALHNSGDGRAAGARL
jgi:hypothetical protein